MALRYDPQHVTGLVPKAGGYAFEVLACEETDFQTGSYGIRLPPAAPDTLVRVRVRHGLLEGCRSVHIEQLQKLGNKTSDVLATLCGTLLREPRRRSGSGQTAHASAFLRATLRRDEVAKVRGVFDRSASVEKDSNVLGNERPLDHDSDAARSGL